MAVLPWLQNTFKVISCNFLVYTFIQIYFIVPGIDTWLTHNNNKKKLQLIKILNES